MNSSMKSKMLFLLTLMLIISLTNICDAQVKPRKMICNANNELKDASIIYGAGLSNCNDVPIENIPGVQCDLTGYPHTAAFVLNLQLHEDTRQFAKMVKVIDKISGPMGYAYSTTCLTCNFTIYDQIAQNVTSDCEASAMFYDLKTKVMCLSKQFDNSNSTDNIQTYYFKPSIPYDTFSPGAILQISLKVDEVEVCKFPVQIRIPANSWQRVTESVNDLKHATDYKTSDIQEAPINTETVLETFVENFQKLKDTATEDQLKELLVEADRLTEKADNSPSNANEKIKDELGNIRRIIVIKLLKQRTLSKQFVKYLILKNNGEVKGDYAKLEEYWNDFVDAECRLLVRNKKLKDEIELKTLCTGDADAVDSLESMERILLQKQQLTSYSLEAKESLKAMLKSLRRKVSIVEQLYSNDKEYYKTSDDPDRPYKHELITSISSKIQRVLSYL